MLQLNHATELIRHVEGLRLRLDALDAASTGICAGMQLNTLGGEAAYQLLDLIATDLKARADAILRMLTEPAAVKPFSSGEALPAGIALVASSAAGRGGRPTPASSASAL